MISRAFQEGVELGHTRTTHGVCKNLPGHRDPRRIRPFTLPKNGKS